MTGSSNDPRAFCECTRQGNAAAAPAKKGRGMAAFANLGGGGCQCNLTHHHQLFMNRFSTTSVSYTHLTLPTK